MRIILSALLFTTSLLAHADYSGHPGAAELIDTLRDEHGFDDAAIARVRAALAEARQLPELIRAEQTAPERTRTWTQYRAMHIAPSTIANGVAFLKEHAETLARAEAEYGVPPELITAILGVETRYGGYTGKTRVLDALATQGFDHPTRTPFFFSELTAFFVLTEERDMDPLAPKGSYAGAMGWAQFMPSNYRRLAVDYDGDGNIDLWTPADAIGSIARYLIDYAPASAWRPGEPMVAAARRFQVRADAIAFNQRDANSTIAGLRALGAEAVDDFDDDMQAGLLRLHQDDGTSLFRIALPNFFAVMRYNPRSFYAMAVGDLAEEISRAIGNPPGRFTP